MFRRIFYSACLAGVGAGLVLTPEAHASAALTTQLILATAAANAVFWLLLGPLRALSFQKLAKT